MFTKRMLMPDPRDAVSDEVVIAQIDPGSRVVDLGCGDGRLLARLRDRHGCEVLGIDATPMRSSRR